MFCMHKTEYRIQYDLQLCFGWYLKNNDMPIYNIIEIHFRVY